ncbi:hypothetical protein V1291_001518 [Nitrobacteraceae bacterium AZCC 1564]
MKKGIFVDGFVGLSTAAQAQYSWTSSNPSSHYRSGYTTQSATYVAHPGNQS